MCAINTENLDASPRQQHAKRRASAPRSDYKNIILCHFALRALAFDRSTAKQFYTKVLVSSVSISDPGQNAKNAA